jgi:hypothetical protein
VLPSWLSFNAATRTFSGTPANGDVGSVTITVTATDGSGASVSDSFDLVIGNSNDAPTLATPIANQAATEDSAFSFQLPAGTFADIDAGDSLSYSTSVLPSWLTFNAATRTLSGTPANADVGTVTITVTATDGAGASVSDSFDLVIGNSNDAPTVASPIVDQTATEDSPFSFQLPAGTFADVDAGDSLSYSTSVLPSWLSFNAASRTFSGTPANADVGTVTITVRATDGSGASVSERFELVVTNVNDAPVLTGQLAMTVAEGATGQVVSAAMLCAVDGDDGASDLGYLLTHVPVHGTLQMGGRLLGVGDGFTQADVDAGRLTYAHDGSESTADGFGFVLSDAAGAVAGGADGAFRIAVTPVNDHLPVLVDVDAAANQVNENRPAGTSVGITVQGHDADAGTSLSFRLTGNPGGLFAIDARTGVVTVTGPIDHEALGPSVALEVTAFSSDGSSATMRFDLAIGDVNEAPSGAPTRVTLSEDTPRSFVVADAGFSDPDAGDRLGSVRIEGLPEVGLLTLAGEPVVLGQVIDAARVDELVYTPPADAHGSALASVVWRVADAAGVAAGEAGSVTIDVAAVNDVPRLTAAQLTLVAGESLVLGPAQMAATDVDDAAGSLVFQVNALVNGRFEVVDRPGVAVSRFTQADVQAGRVRFVATSASESPAFELSVSDGSAGSQAVAVAVRFNRAASTGPVETAPSAPPAALPSGTAPAVTPPKAAVTAEAGGSKSPGATRDSEGGLGASLQAQVLAQPLQADQVDEAAAARLLRSAVEASAAARHEASRGAGASGAGMGFDGRGASLEDLLAAGWEFDAVDSTVDLPLEPLGLGEPRRAGRGAQDAALADTDESAEDRLMLTTEAAQAASVVLTAGSVWWALRAGGLVASLMGALPAWRHVDLLAVLPDDEEGEAWDRDADEEAVRDELAVGRLLEDSPEGQGS